MDESELLQNPECIVCQGSARPVSKLESGNGKIAILECRNCYHVFTGRYPSTLSPSAGAQSTETTEDFTNSLLDQSEAVKERQRVLARNRSRIYSRALINSGTPLRILEIGCGSGGLGVAFTELGHSYLGIDIDQRVIDAGKLTGANVVQGDFMDFEHEGEFDIVFFSQVLEHMTMPTDFMRKVASHLADNSIVHADVPNHDALAGLPSRYLGVRGMRFGAIDWPHHCSAFNARSLRALSELLPEMKVDVFTATPHHDTWGQAGDPRFKEKSYFAASKILDKKSLLVLFGTRKKIDG